MLYKYVVITCLVLLLREQGSHAKISQPEKQASSRL